ncbi:MAG: acyltransferase [Kiritimatiellales bacterium]|nr:acyltransferase [Kiritimatiellales bacterium]
MANTTVFRVLAAEFKGLSPRLAAIQALARLLPAGNFLRVRALLYRTAGLRIGHGTVIAGKLNLSGDVAHCDKLTIGRNCYFNTGVHINLGGAVRIADRVSLGMDCLIVSASHKIGTSSFRAGPGTADPVVIGAGSWLGARAVVLPGVEIGKGTVIAAGAVVTKSLPANVVAAGIPARVKRGLSA